MNALEMQARNRETEKRRAGLTGGAKIVALVFLLILFVKDKFNE